MNALSIWKENKLSSFEFGDGKEYYPEETIIQGNTVINYPTYDSIKFSYEFLDQLQKK